MFQFWVSCIIQEKETSKPYMQFFDACQSMEAAMILVNKAKNNFRILSIWVETYDINNVKTVLLHECYLNSLGTLSYK